MKKRIFTYGIILTAIVTLSNSCDCYEDHITDILTIDVTDTTVDRGEKVNIETTFKANNGCGEFSKFEEDNNDLTTEISIEVEYKDCQCTTNMPTLTTNYEFRSWKKGTHTLKFKTSDGEYLIAKIKVE